MSGVRQPSPSHSAQGKGLVIIIVIQHMSSGARLVGGQAALLVAQRPVLGHPLEVVLRPRAAAAAAAAASFFRPRPVPRRTPARRIRPAPLRGSLFVMINSLLTPY